MQHLARYAQFVIQIFSVRYLPLHAVAIIATVLIVTTGLDWVYLVYVLETFPSWILFVADMFGLAIPIFLLLLSIGVLVLKKNVWHRACALAMLYSITLGFTLSTIIKVFTGRTSPPHRHHGVELVLIDNSHAFNFGFLKEQIIGGWPSSHATIAFALATTLALVLPTHWYIRMTLFAVAFFIGIGVTFGFHWFSEFVAGACLGVETGLVVGSHYRKMMHMNLK